MICVGIDVAKDKHDCYILNTEGEVLADVFTITNSREGFNILLDKTHSISHVEDKKKSRTRGNWTLQLQHSRIST